MAEHNRTDEDLMTATGRDDLEAFAELVNRHQVWAWRLAYRLLGNTINAEDIAQEAFIRLLHAAPRFRPRASFRTYFYRIITRLCLDLARKKRTFSMDCLPDPPSPNQDPARPIIDRELSAAVRLALDDLPANQRTAVVLRYYEDLDYRGIADAMQISPKAVERLLARARKHLRSLLSG